MSYFYLINEKLIETTTPIEGAEVITREQYDQLAPFPPNLTGFRAAIAALPEWDILMTNDPRTVELSRLIAANAFTEAKIWWDRIVASGKVSAELKAAIAEAAIANNMPQAVLDALA